MCQHIFIISERKNGDTSITVHRGSQRIRLETLKIHKKTTEVLFSYNYSSYTKKNPNTHTHTPPKPPQSGALRHERITHQKRVRFRPRHSCALRTRRERRAGPGRERRAGAARAVLGRCGGPGPADGGPGPPAGRREAPGRGSWPEDGAGLRSIGVSSTGSVLRSLSGYRRPAPRRGRRGPARWNPAAAEGGAALTGRAGRRPPLARARGCSRRALAAPWRATGTAPRARTARAAPG